ncbi:hypothetical protein GCM10010912_15100 [Paenibacillus albidus]|uniref:Uncharacterized protein n=1 Tax=Paenibacillus albidus TaxID=2041023 RepID=A0A917C4V1_9BACL|nr:hypothetical protein GCM10010912_15100 [Paenibacillus albidus]
MAQPKQYLPVRFRAKSNFNVFDAAKSHWDGSKVHSDVFRAANV